MPSSFFTSSILHRSNNAMTIFDRTVLQYNKTYNNCSNTLCYTYSKNFIYKPHSNYGSVGTHAAGRISQRKIL